MVLKDLDVTETVWLGNLLVFSKLWPEVDCEMGQLFLSKIKLKFKKIETRNRLNRYCQKIIPQTFEN